MYNPDFDSKTGKKQAATPMNKGFTAFNFCHKYVGNRLLFAFSQNIFYLS
jgi:hypothetical protein